MKRIVSVIMLLVMALLFVPVGRASQQPAPGSGEPEPSGRSVYVSPEEQEYIYDLLMDKNGGLIRHFERLNVWPVKGSVTQRYYIDLLEYAENERFEVKPFEIKYFLGPDDTRDTQCYLVKTVSKDNRFTGNLTFCIKDGAAVFLSQEMTDAVEGFSDKKAYTASCSYADHARRIAAILKSDEIIPPENVLYVGLKGYRNRVGDCFYVRLNGEDLFIPVGMVYNDPVYSDGNLDVVLTADELKEIALQDREAYLAHLEYLEEWRKEHPDSDWIPVGDGSESPEIISVCSSVDNIIDIEKFFADLKASEKTDPAVKSPSPDPAAQSPSPDPVLNGHEEASSGEGRGNTVLWIAVPAALTAAALCILLVNKKRVAR